MDETFGLGGLGGTDAGRERRVRELCEEISRKRLAGKKRRRKTALDAMMEDIRTIPGATWDASSEFERDLQALGLDETLTKYERAGMIRVNRMFPLPKK